MKKYRKLVLITILFLTIGFSAINTVLDINGIISFGYNEEDFNVYFYNVKKDNQNVNEVISEDKKSITVSTSDLLIVGDKAIYNYTIANTSKNYDANVKIECESPTSESISLTNVFLNRTIIAGTKEAGTLTLEYLSETTEITEYTCTLSIEAIERTSLGEEFIFCDYEIGTEWTYDYTGTEQEFVVPCDGTYKLEVWGAQGGIHETSIGRAGYGGYSKGNMNFVRNSQIYIIVGEQGTGAADAIDGYSKIIPGGYNGGGAARTWWDNKLVGSGGGATHISGIKKELKYLEGNLEEVYIVSGGGGGAGIALENTYYSGDGGGYQGNSGYTGTNLWTGSGGSQLTGGDYSLQSSPNIVLGTDSGFGTGQYIYEVHEYGYYGNSSGGGGGYYGGGAGVGAGGFAGGGSGYIGNPLLTDKAMYCYNCQESSVTETKTVSTTNVSENPISEYAKQGNGYARITLISID